MGIDIKQGDIRFIVLFEDADLTVPIVQTLRFLQATHSDSGEPLLIFTQIHSATRREKFFVRERDFEELVVDSQGLLGVLQRSFDGLVAKSTPGNR